MSKQCPRCKNIVDSSTVKCAGCGLRFIFSGRRNSLSATCLRIGGYAVLLAAVTFAFMRLM